MSEYEKWLASLQVGDEVCYHSRWNGYTIIKIEKITPTRQIKTTFGHVFKGGYSRDSGYTIKPITDEVRSAVRRGNLLGKVNNFEFTKCNLEQLERVAAIIDEVDVE